MTIETHSRIALKEWAVAIEALASGNQIIILRKGGIHREDKEFRVLHPEFLLYPTYEHQKTELVKSDQKDKLRETVETNKSQDRLCLSYWCEVTHKFQVSEPEMLGRLNEHHIWEANYASSRLHWRPKQPLTVAIVRVHRIGEPQYLDILPEYGGCKSWVTLNQEVPLGSMKPVIESDEYLYKVEKIQSLLEGAPILS